MDEHRLDDISRAVAAAATTRREPQRLPPGAGPGWVAARLEGWPALAATCGALETKCDGDCVNLSTDHDHCGACGNRCGRD
jgi:hypothetical protein